MLISLSEEESQEHIDTTWKALKRGVVFNATLTDSDCRVEYYMCFSDADAKGVGVIMLEEKLISEGITVFKIYKEDISVINLKD
jgi:hypothetical protein